MPNIQYQMTPTGVQPVEEGWLTSSVVRRWWLYFSWWVIPLGYILIFGPHLYYNMSSSGGGASLPAHVWKVVSPPSPKHAHRPPTPTPSKAPDRELTPEERSQRFKEYLRRRDQ